MNEKSANDHYIYDIWVNPKTGDDVWRCHRLGKLPNQNKYICRIHDRSKRLFPFLLNRFYTLLYQLFFSEFEQLSKLHETYYKAVSVQF